jgi:hypothetical protein
MGSHNFRLSGDLYPVETDKLNRIGAVLQHTFSQSGYVGVGVKANGAGTMRTLTFYSVVNNHPLISFSSLAFLASTSTELSRMIRGQLSLLERRNRHSVHHSQRMATAGG